MSKEFLPQYAAQAIIDLEWYAKQLKKTGTDKGKIFAGCFDLVSVLIRHAVHIVLPPNGEIYRDNQYGGACPTSDECESFAGLPAPVCCFQYPFKIGDAIGLKDSLHAAPKRITLAIDGKQHFDQPREGYQVQLFSIIYSEKEGTWGISPTSLILKCPLVAVENKQIRMIGGDGAGYGWGISSGAILRDLISFQNVESADKAKTVFGEWMPDITAVMQCCHALRAGATLEEKVETSPARRWKFDKHGVGGFTYHVLKLPGHAVRTDGNGGGSHDSPRLHIRRAHIRKLPTGVLTFVRQCFVGNPDKGVVEKHYSVRNQP